MSTLPENLILNSSERGEVQRHLHELERYISLSQFITIRETTMPNDTAIGVLIAGLLIKGKGAKLDKASSDALTEDYLDALEDLPAWSIREALRKWNRAESVRLDGKPHDFNWRPEPPTLRRLAQQELVSVKARMLVLQKLCGAVPMAEFSDEHRKEMLQKMQGLVVVKRVETAA